MLKNSELFANCKQLKLKARDGKSYNTDVVDESGLNTVIVLIPSKKTEVFARWMKNIETSLDEKTSKKLTSFLKAALSITSKSERRKGCSRSTATFSADSMISLDRSERSTLLKAVLPLRPRYIWTERLRISKKCPKPCSPVFAPEDKDSLVGYMVCRIDYTCVWVEHIFILEGYRRKGLSSVLFQKAEEIAASMEEETVYNYVHPNNEGMIRFLRSKGYTVLNLIEIRKPYANEKLTTTIQVDKETFDY